MVSSIGTFFIKKQPVIKNKRRNNQIKVQFNMNENIRTEKLNLRILIILYSINIVKIQIFIIFQISFAQAH
jgi:hypothetical protein